MFVRLSVCERGGFSVRVCRVVCLSRDRLGRKENEEETDTNRQYMFLIRPLCAREHYNER